MALKPISEMRREEIAAAALLVLTTEGARALTLDRVARELGASKGIILHYYSSKDLLLSRVISDILKILSKEIQSVVANAVGEQGRIAARLEFCVNPDIFQNGYASAWLTVLEASNADPTLARFRRIVRGRLNAALKSDLRPVVGQMEAAPVAESLLALIDGLWLRRALEPSLLSPERAKALLLTHLEESLAFSARS